jgi:Phosphotyrosine interaction domain (PTB/PID)
LQAQFIAQSIGQAFQVAYMEFLKANGIEDQSFVREMDYQEVLNSQEIFGDELQMFAKKELQKEVLLLLRLPKSFSSGRTAGRKSRLAPLFACSLNIGFN